jgi:hypothetical protein
MKWLPWFYFPTSGGWLIWLERPRVAVDWFDGVTIRFNLRTYVRRRRSLV